MATTTKAPKATEKQVRFIMMLLPKAGFRTDWMDRTFSRLGATMRERSGRVEDWVSSLTISEASSLIDELKRMAK